MSNPRRSVVMTAFLCLVGLSGLAACGMDDDQGELIYRVTTPEGAVADKEDIRITVNRLDTALTKAGYKRKDVHALGPGKIRVVLPENVVPKLAEIRALLEQETELTTTLTLAK